MKSFINLPALTTKKAKKKILKSSTRLTLQDHSTRLDEEDFLFSLNPSSNSEAKESLSASLSPTKADNRVNFFESLRKLPLLEKRQQEEVSVSMAYINECFRQSLSPIPVGLACSNSDSVSVQNYGMGDNYAKAFSKGVTKMKNLEKLNLGANSLSPRGTKVILTKVALKPLKELNLKDNRMNLKSLKPLISIFQKENPTLKYLNLENTRISEKEIVRLCEVIANDRVLIFLGLAMNSLGTTSALALKSMLSENHYLKKLDLHWNNLKDQGSLQIFEGLCKNDSLKELDISWNSIGQSRDKTHVRSISACLSKIQGLAHLDLSFNSLNNEECKVLSEGLRRNHDLLGIHLMGNEGFIDSQGFLVPTNQTMHFEQSHLFKRLFDDIRTVQLSLKRRPKLRCWICEGWVEMKFVWTLGVSGGSNNGDMFIHLDCDNYEPDLMKFGNSTYEIKRVVPPGEVKFFFTKNNFMLRSKEYNLFELPKPEEKEIRFSEKVSVNLVLHVINKTSAKGPPCEYRNPFKTLPRNPKFNYQPPPDKWERVQWDIGKSLFKDYRMLNQKLAEDCFEFDWAQSKMQNWVKASEQDELKDLLKDHYQEIIETFRFLGSQSGNEYFTVGSNIFNEFLNQSNVFDSVYDQSDLGVNWNSVLVSKDKKQPYNPGNALVRYQFTEILVRIANDRYMRPKLCSSISEALKMLINEKIGLILTQNNSSLWRHKEYLCEAVDVVLKAYKPIIDSIFKVYSGKKSLPGQKPFMCIEEFRQMCFDGKIVPEKFPARELDGCFVLAMMVQVDELFEKKHVEMTFVEFLEAFCRVSWYIQARNQDKEKEQSFSEFSKVGIEVELKEKIEKAMWNLFQLCPRTVQDSFAFPNQEVYKSFMYKFERMPTTIKETYKDSDDER